jgi:hypothetical protein
MSQQQSEETKSIQLTILMEDASDLPMPYVNAIEIRAGVAEFFITLGVAQPPSQAEIAAMTEAGTIPARPVARFAISYETMEQFLTLMASQYDQQIRIRQRMHHHDEGAINEEEGKNEQYYSLTCYFRAWQRESRCASTDE